MSKFLYALEERAAISLFAATVLLVLAGAIGRSAGHPLIWSIDMAQALFAWTCMLGADIALKNKGHIVIDIAVRRLPEGAQSALAYLWLIVIAAFLVLLIYLGFMLTKSNTQRLIGDLSISYAWVTASIPVGAGLMLISTVARFVHFITGKEASCISGHDGEAL